MSIGWVKLHRQALDNGWLKNPVLWAFWSYCLLRANHKPCTTIVGYQQVQLEPGQFIFGRKQAMEDLSLSEQNIKTCLKNLKNTKNLTVKVTNKFSVITVVNWHIYQDEEEETNQQTNQRLTSNSPATNHRQECKEVKEENLVTKKTSSPPSKAKKQKPSSKEMLYIEKYWRWAYGQTQEEAFIPNYSRDRKIINELLDRTKPGEILLRMAHYLKMKNRFPPGLPTIPGFSSQIEKIPTANGIDVSDITPQGQMKWSLFTPWEDEENLVKEGSRENETETDDGTHTYLPNDEATLPLLC